GCAVSGRRTKMTRRSGCEVDAEGGARAVSDTGPLASPRRCASNPRTTHLRGETARTKPVELAAPERVEKTGGPGRASTTGFGAERREVGVPRPAMCELPHLATRRRGGARGQFGRVDDAATLLPVHPPSAPYPDTLSGLPTPTCGDFKTYTWW